MLWFNTCNYLFPWRAFFFSWFCLYRLPIWCHTFPLVFGRNQCILLVPMLAGMGHCATSAVGSPSLPQFSCWLLFLFPTDAPQPSGELLPLWLLLSTEQPLCHEGVLSCCPTSKISSCPLFWVPFLAMTLVSSVLPNEAACPGLHTLRPRC